MVFLPLLGSGLESLRQFQIIGAGMAGSAPSGPLTVCIFEVNISQWY